MTANTTNSYLDDFMDKLTTVPNDVNRNLRLIRKLDKRVQDIQVVLQPLQNKFLAAIKQLKEKKITELTPALKADLEIIQVKQKEIYGYSKEKKEIADQLLHQVSELSANLQSEIRAKNKDDQDIFKRRKQKIDASKQGQTKISKDFQYDFTKQPQYCICGNGSYGEMVACENPYCERQWFHMGCIDQKTLPEKYYCKDCQPIRDRTKNPTSRQFLISKDNNN